MSNLLKKRNAIYGICAIWIVLFHTFRRISMPYIPVITNIIGIGNMAVDIFFFLSGVCLSLSAARQRYLEKGWAEYYKRRFIRIILPYLIICIPYYLWATAFESTGTFVHRVIAFVANFSSATFWLRGIQTTWYLYGIALFYILFPFLYRFAIQNGWKKKFILLLGVIAFAITTAYVPVLKNSMILWARLPIFLIGTFVGASEKMPETRKTIVRVVSATVFILLGVLTSMSELSKSFTIPQVYRLLLYIPMTISLMILLSTPPTRRARLFKWIGSFSLEVYLVHITLLHPVKYYGMMDAVGYWLYLILPVVSVLIAWVFARIEDLILKKGKAA